MSTTCRRCNTPVRWVTVARSGTPMPINPKPDRERGNVALIEPGDPWPGERGQAVVLKKHEVGPLRASGRALYLAHFATCPKLRRRGRRGR